MKASPIIVECLKGKGAYDIKAVTEFRDTYVGLNRTDKMLLTRRINALKKEIQQLAWILRTLTGAVGNLQSIQNGPLAMLRQQDQTNTELLDAHYRIVGAMHDLVGAINHMREYNQKAQRRHAAKR